MNTIDENNKLAADGFVAGVEWERAPYAHHHTLLIAITAAVRIEGTQKKAAAKFGISPQYLNDILKGNREIPDKVARHFGVRRVVRYERFEA